MTEQQKHSNDIVEVKGKIGRIEDHVKKFEQNQLNLELMTEANSKKLDTLLNTITDSPYNADNGLIKRINYIEKTVDNHVLFWRIFIGSLSGGSVLWLFINMIIK